MINKVFQYGTWDVEWKTFCYVRMEISMVTESDVGNEKENIDDGIEMYRIEDLIMNGVCVSNLAYLIAEELGCDKVFCDKMAMAGLVHDIGKVRIYTYIYGDSEDHTLTVKKLRYIRMHSKLGYDILLDEGFDKDILEAVLYHHENYDGSGYPENIAGEDIPFGARILRVCDVFAALISDRVYRKAFDVNTAIELMIEEVKNFDMKIFLTFMKVIHEVNINKITGKDE